MILKKTIKYPQGHRTSKASSCFKLTTFELLCAPGSVRLVCKMRWKDWKSWCFKLRNLLWGSQERLGTCIFVRTERFRACLSICNKAGSFRMLVRQWPQVIMKEVLRENLQTKADLGDFSSLAFDTTSKYFLTSKEWSMFDLYVIYSLSKNWRKKTFHFFELESCLGNDAGAMSRREAGFARGIYSTSRSQRPSGCAHRRNRPLDSNKTSQDITSECLGCLSDERVHWPNQELLNASQSRYAWIDSGDMVTQDRGGKADCVEDEPPKTWLRWNMMLWLGRTLPTIVTWVLLSRPANTQFF